MAIQGYLSGGSTGVPPTIRAIPRPPIDPRPPSTQILHFAFLHAALRIQFLARRIVRYKHSKRHVPFVSSDAMAPRLRPNSWTKRCIPLPETHHSMQNKTPLLHRNDGNTRRVSGFSLVDTITVGMMGRKGSTIEAKEQIREKTIVQSRRVPSIPCVDILH